MTRRDLLGGAVALTAAVTVPRAADAAPAVPKPGALALDRLGGPDTFARIAAATRIKADWVERRPGPNGFEIATRSERSTTLGASAARRLAALLADDRVYAIHGWESPASIPRPGQSPAFERVYSFTLRSGAFPSEPWPVSVEVVPERHELRISWTRTPPAPEAPVSRLTLGRIDPVMAPLLSLLRDAFPDDPTVRRLRPTPAPTTAQARANFVSVLPAEIAARLDAVRPGMTRAAITGRFETEGGVYSTSARSYVVGEVADIASLPALLPVGGRTLDRLVKAEVRFAPAGRRLVWIDGIGYPLDAPATREPYFGERPDDVILYVRPHFGYRAYD